MSDLVVLGLKLLFLALLWLFVLFAVNVIRTDLFGRKVEASAVAGSDAVALPSPAPIPAQPVAQPAPEAAKQRRWGRPKLPTTLRITDGPNAGASLPLGESILIGRTPDATLDLHDQYMSSRHAVIARTPSGYVVEDLGSTNGTYVNDRRITAPTPITPADTLRIGRTTIIVDK